MKRRSEPASAIFIRICAILLLIMTSASSIALAADLTPDSTRVGIAGDKFAGVTQLAVTFQQSKLTYLRANHYELAVGGMWSSEGNSAFLSFGPVWRVPIARARMFIDFGISPTLVSEPRLAARDLGGHFHFTSFISTGIRLGQTSALSIRLQHVSNGGLNATNPGMDMLGLELSIRFSD